MTTHAQLPDPTDEDIRAALATHDSAIVELALAVRALVHETLPDVREVLDTTDGGLGFGARQYGADGWGIAALAAASRWVSLFFTAGAELSDPSRLLEGSGKRMRHVKIRSLAELDERRETLRSLVLAAAGR